MFGTLLGSLPRPPLPADAAPEELLGAVLRAQEEAGLEPVSDAGFGIGDAVVERWRTTAALTDRLVKQALLGPYSVGRQAAGRVDVAGTDATGAGAARAQATTAAVETLRADLLALAAAGCPCIEVH